MWKDAKACNPCRLLSDNSFQGFSSLIVYEKAVHCPNRYLIDLLDHEQFFLVEYCKYYSYLAFRFAMVQKDLRKSHLTVYAIFLMTFWLD